MNGQFLLGVKNMAPADGCLTRAYPNRGIKKTRRADGAGRGCECQIVSVNYLCRLRQPTNPSDNKLRADSAKVEGSGTKATS